MAEFIDYLIPLFGGLFAMFVPDSALEKGTFLANKKKRVYLRRIGLALVILSLFGIVYKML